jgi:hypothetical protein
MAKHANTSKHKSRSSNTVRKEEDCGYIGSSNSIKRSSVEKQKKWKSSHDYQGNKLFEEFLLAEHGLRIVEMAGDGNCLFRSIAHQLENNPNLHMQYRQSIIKYIISKRKHFELFLEDDEKFEDYIERMKLFGTWGGHHELYAAAQCLRINIEVFQWNAPKYIILYDPTIHGKSQNNNCNNNAIRTIQLSFHGDCHFNSVVGDSPPIELSYFPPIASNSQKSDDNLNKSCDELLLNVVSSAVPWSKSADVIAALRQSNYQKDVAIEYLCTGLSEVVVEGNEFIDKDIYTEDSVEQRALSEAQNVTGETADDGSNNDVKQCLVAELPQSCEDEWTEVVRKPKKNINAATQAGLSKKVLLY